MSDIATQRDPIAPDDKIRQTYAQDWPAYDAAKTNEDVLFKRLMQELLLLAVENPSPQRTGSPSFDTRTKLFAMAIKTYYKSDLRKTTSILKELHHLKLIPATPCYKSIDNFFNDASLGPVLDHLILLTALPLADVERVAAMDSTGFGMRKYDSWQATKWGTVQTGRQRSFRKLHAVVGCKTNIFVSVEVTEKNVADVTMLPSVVGNRPKYFDFQDFVADKAYSSRAVYKFLDKLGLDTYIPFKRGSSSRAGGARHWKVMFEFFKKNPDSYMLHYHQRSNVETCFHMLKARFGHHLLTKNFVANQNEIKMRVLVHNLTVLIQEAAELGILVNFDDCV